MREVSKNEDRRHFHDLWIHALSSSFCEPVPEYKSLWGERERTQSCGLKAVGGLVLSVVM